ncbi:ATP-dependent zinc metalloprotease FtsH [Sedimentibacter hydroxybenzoicus DSM 7310]|uniref:ATP-dependent zinc metalloprotease FtsH n=1 Tax=Sedimentibacter hydroxybenzoicus DSM 7310 TaxID=1123245 RepID=A0A974BGT2_SEDHY|nr:AAA family ATPase [Sedimentibacter hydroxybenzoicus]NYB72661.1 ATP-dependent zinc metalloprotease FtsH [Sedimentibacter hydroxybenzoicus DSM 7310]
MDKFQIAGIIIVLIFVILLLLRNKKTAQKEINKLNEIEYVSSSNMKFDDVAGNYEAKDSLQEIVDFIKNPEKYSRFNARMPKGVLLYGSPGTGKTLMAKALAGEAGVPFYAVSGSDFVQVYAGLGAGRIRNLFKKAKKSGKSVVFIDEIDAIGKKRMNGNMRGSDEGDRTLNALLTEMSGFSDDSGTVVIAATNRIDTLDSALLRPGRFDRQIEIMLPDRNARKDILRLYLSRKKAKSDIDIEEIADLTVYFSGAMIENLVNEAALTAIRENADEITEEHINKAYLEIIAGTEKKNLAENSKQKIVTSYHEAGHAFVSKHLIPDSKIVRVSVIPTSKGAGGYTLSTPDGAEVITKKRIKNQLAVLMAGRVAEEVFFGKENITVGAQNDIEKATSLAVDYIARYGMDDGNSFVNLGVLAEKLNIPLSSVEKSVKDLVAEIYKDVIKIIESNKEKIEKIAKLLMEKEVVYEEELNVILS